MSLEIGDNLKEALIILFLVGIPMLGSVLAIVFG